MERLATDSLLRSDQAESFAANGFLTFEQLVSAYELRELKKTIEDLFEKRAGEKEGAHLDLVAPGKPGTIQTSPQITNPVNYRRDFIKLSFSRTRWPLPNDFR